MVKRRRVPKDKTSRDWRFYPSERDADKCRAALATYDAVVRAKEVHWGIDRLPLLVEAELRDRFWAQMDVLNVAIEKGSGVEALERRATGLGAEPVSGEVWEETTPKGSVIAVCRDRSEIAKIRDSGRVDRVYAMSEVAAIVEAFEDGKAGDLTKKVKSLFEGATIDNVQPRTREELTSLLNDEIPF